MTKTESAMQGEVGVLNVGLGDTKLSFDKSDPAERIRAARIVRDMLRRGYALLVEVEPGKFQRAKDFDDETCEYIVADFDPVQAEAADRAERSCSCRAGGVSAACPVHGDAEHKQPTGDPERVQTSSPETKTEAAPGAVDATAAPRRGRKKRIDAGSTRGIAVGRTAGG
jgi:hypothetical protein